MKLLKTILLFGVSSSLTVSESNANSADYGTDKYNLHFEETCKNGRCHGSVKRTSNDSRKAKTVTWKRCTKAKLRLVFKLIFWAHNIILIWYNYLKTIIRKINALNIDPSLKFHFVKPSCVPASSVFSGSSMKIIN